MSARYRGQMKMVTLRCEECGCEMFIWRKGGKLKEKEHVKHLWCRRCEDRTAHVELRGE